MSERANKESLETKNATGVGGAAVSEIDIKSQRDEAMDATSRLRMEACLISDTDLNSADRMKWAESVAKDYLKTSNKDGNLTGLVGEELKRAGVEVENKKYTPDYKWNGWEKEELEQVSLKFNRACKEDPNSQMTIEITPMAGDNKEVSFNRPNATANGIKQNEIIKVYLHDEQPVVSSLERADGTFERIDLDRKGDERFARTKTSGDYTKNTREVTEYAGSQPRGHEIPKYIDRKFENGSKELTLFENGVPTEKFQFNKRQHLTGYNAFDEKGNELPAWSPKSISGRAYYEGRELTGRIGAAANDAYLSFQLWRLKQSMPR